MRAFVKLEFLQATNSQVSSPCTNVLSVKSNRIYKALYATYRLSPHCKAKHQPASADPCPVNGPLTSGHIIHTIHYFLLLWSYVVLNNSGYKVTSDSSHLLDICKLWAIHRPNLVKLSWHPKKTAGLCDRSIPRYLRNSHKCSWKLLSLSRAATIRSLNNALRSLICPCSKNEITYYCFLHPLHVIDKYNWYQEKSPHERLKTDIPTQQWQL